jgi:hypothetical protein
LPFSIYITCIKSGDYGGGQALARAKLNLGKNPRLEKFEVIWRQMPLGKGGQIVGSTNEFGLTAEENKMPVSDVHTTVLRCLGFDHTRLTYHYNGRQLRLNNVEGEVIKEILV